MQSRGKTVSIELPDGCIESHRVTIISYLTPDGGAAYTVDTRGDLPMTSYLGLLVVAQQEILRWADDD